MQSLFILLGTRALLAGCTLDWIWSHVRFQHGKWVKQKLFLQNITLQFMTEMPVDGGFVSQILHNKQKANFFFWKGNGTGYFYWYTF
uniref:Putative secreted protein n=1 Tax=Ixodes ricinus TaxID=34613 RepID=A0A6B0TZ95_IXORI